MSKMLFMALASTHQAEERHEAARAMVGPHLRSQVKREPPLPNELEDSINQGTEGGNSAVKNRHSIAESHRFRDDRPYHNIPLRVTAYLFPTLSPSASHLHPRKILQCLTCYLQNTPSKPEAHTSPQSASHA